MYFSTFITLDLENLCKDKLNYVFGVTIFTFFLTPFIFIGEITPIFTHTNHY